MPRPLQALSLFVLIACVAGCNTYESRLPETGASVEGTVTYGGETVPMALVVVIGQKGQATGQIEEGRYKVENAPLGEVKIGINTEAIKGQMISQQMAQSYKGPGSKTGTRTPAPRLVEVPSKYWEPEKSGITTTVKRGTNTHNIVLNK
jgi:hypothetical protein